MSEIVFNCVKCGAKLSATEEEAGDEFECPVCQTTQAVPGGEEPQEAKETPAPPAPRPSTRVVRVPKKKIVLAAAKAEEEEEAEEEIEEIIEAETGSSGLRVVAMAIGTAGAVLCVMSLTWIVLAQRLPDNGDREWWQLMLAFVSMFLLSMMALVLAGVAFRVERIAARLELLERGE